MMFRNAIFATIAYADVFDYPLTKEEIGRWLIQNFKFQISNFKLKKIRGLQTTDGFFFLKGRKKIVAVRKKRQRWVKEKMQVAWRTATLLKSIPTIQLVGITGALAMENAHRDDDIDFYIVTRAGALWTTRFFATTLLALFGLRRKPGDTTFCNKICLNMYVDEERLSVPKRERDLFAAHEVLQMKLLWERNGTYQRFLHANKWVKYFLPNAWGGKCQMINDKWSIKNSKNKFSIWHLAFSIAEPLTHWFQKWFMKNRMTSEVVSPTLIRFHPRDARVWIRSKLAARLAKRKIPLDKIFYAG